LAGLIQITRPICFVVLLVSFFSPIHPSQAVAAEKFFYPPNEEFTYEVHFLSLINAGTSRIQIQKKSGNRYEARMVAETKGIVGFFTRYRKNSYTSEMEYIPEQRRLITRRFTKIVTWGDEIRKSVSENDYRSRIHRWVVTENGKFKSKGSEKIPEGVIYEDMISAFFNLRYGAFGPIKPGRRITVISQPFSQASMVESKKDSEEYLREFEIRIADKITERKYRQRLGRKHEKGALVLINAPNDFFGQNKGDVIIWFDNKMIPVGTTVEDVFLFGDVTGTLVKTRIQPVSPVQLLGSSVRGAHVIR
jgi:hypothetical protein